MAMPGLMATDERKLLRIYLNDHLAGATAGIHLARRCLSSNQGTALGAFLEELLVEIGEDRTTLMDLMDALHLTRDPAKQALAVVGERVARLKLNGRLRGYSDLSRLVELEGLVGGVNVKRRLWHALQRVASSYAAIGATDLDRLIHRADSQLERLETYRQEAAARAFATVREPSEPRA
ncbi:MAG: hypothetical protein WD250_02650 [Egibacteraceae bacterium]